MSARRPSRSSRLAAVWFADIAGYTRLSAADHSTSLDLVDVLQASAHEQIERHGGRLVKFTGDGVLAEFSSARAAVRAASGLQREFSTRTANAGHAAALRVGVHIGEVAAAEDGDIYGEGVNIASRLQEEAQPGRVLVSDDVWRHLRSRSEFSFTPMGRRKLKGLSRPISVYDARSADGVGRRADELSLMWKHPSAVLEMVRQRMRSVPRSVRYAVAPLVALLVVAGGFWLTGALERTGSVDRLAVLPLTNLMNDPDQEYFVRGMHDGLISELQQAGVSVIARTSVMRYADGETPIRQIGQELGVDAVVEGTVLRAGDSVEIDARIVDADTEEYVWGESFAGNLGDVVALHRDLTRAIAAEIDAALAPSVEARLAEAEPVDPDAYDAYLKGIFHSQRFTPEDLSTALEYFETVLAIDSTYAPAYVGIARVWLFRAQATQATGVTALETRAKYQPALRRALALNSTLAEAHMAAGGATAWNEWKFEQGMAALRRALSLNPELPEARIFYGHLLTIFGRWNEAAVHVERAVELDPLNPFIQGLYGVQLMLTRQHERAIKVMEEMFRRNPGAGFGRAALGRGYAIVGRYEDALRIMRDAARARGEHYVVDALDRGYHSGGYHAALRLAADSMAARARKGSRQPGGIGEIYARVGEEEKAVAWLEKAVEARDQNMPYIGVAPAFEVLHDRPDFQELTRRVGVPIVTDAGKPDPPRVMTGR